VQVPGTAKKSLTPSSSILWAKRVPILWSVGENLGVINGDIKLGRAKSSVTPALSGILNTIRPLTLAEEKFKFHGELGLLRELSQLRVRLHLPFSIIS
jgi:hypothetical protein